MGSRRQSWRWISGGWVVSGGRVLPVVLLVILVLAGCWVPVKLAAQQVRLLRTERLPEFGVTAQYWKIDGGVQGPRLPTVVNYYLDAGGRWWLTAETGLFRFDGRRAELLPFQPATSRALRPYGLHPLEDGRVLVSYISRLVHTTQIAAMAILHPQTGTIQEVPLPQTGRAQPLWAFHSSVYGHYLLANDGRSFRWDVSQDEWKVDSVVVPLLADARPIARTAEGFLSLKERKYPQYDYFLTAQGESVRVGQSIHPVYSALNGRRDPFIFFALEGGRMTRLLGLNPSGGEVRDIMAHPLLANAEITNSFPRVFYTENTRELWIYEKAAGRITALDTRTQEITRRFEIGEFFTNRSPVSLAAYGNQVFISSESGTIWISTDPIVVENQYSELGSVRSICLMGRDLMVSSYKGTFILPAQEGGGFGQPRRHYLVPEEEGKGALTIIDIFRDQVNTHWLGMSGAMWRYQSDRGQVDKRFPLPAETDRLDIWSLEQNGRYLIAGTDNGIRLFDRRRETWIQRQGEELPFTGMRVYGFIQESPFRWVAYGHQGFYALEFERDSLSRAELIFPESQHLHTYYVYDDPSGYWWLGTDSGIKVLEKASGRFLFEELLLPLRDKEVYAIYPDEQQHLWASTSAGLYRIHALRNSLYHFTGRDGLTELEFNRNAHLVLPDGRLVFGGISGITFVDPRRMTAAQTDVLTHPRPNWTCSADPWQQSPMGGQVLECGLSGETGMLELRLDGLVAPCPDCRYAYRPVGTEGPWQMGAGEQVVIAMTTPGRHRFEVWQEVKGYWVALPEVALYVPARWPVMAWWFMAMLAFIFGIVLYGMTRRYRKLRQTDTSPAPVVTTPAALRQEPPNHDEIGEEEVLQEGKLFEAGAAPDTTDLAAEVGQSSEAEGRRWVEIFDEMLGQHYPDSSLSVTMMAQMMHMSSRHLLRVCKERTGRAPVEYLMDFRMARARDYLRDKPLATISEVCYAVGMSTPSYFSRCFAERFGESPLKYQKRILSGNRD